MIIVERDIIDDMKWNSGRVGAGCTLVWGFLTSSLELESDELSSFLFLGMVGDGLLKLT